MANLVIDIGNTQTKIAVFKGSEMLWFEKVDITDANYINTIIKKHNVLRAIASSVKKNQTFTGTLVPIISFNNTMAGLINNHYSTPLTLGADRLAAVTGAIMVNPGIDTLVIDAGTCITYDFIDSGRNYYGGSISPGLEMRYKAVNHYTAALPLVEVDAEFTAEFGNSTETAIRSGVQNGVKYEAEGFISAHKKQHPYLNILLTGGGAIFLDTLLKNSIFAPYIKNDPYLVLKGLNAVIQDQND